MDLSIIIPVYNGEETIKLCLDAVSALKIPEGTNVEVLLVNDGSTDRTKEIAAAYPCVTIIDLEKNMGRVVARKTGAEKAKYGDLLFVDSRVEIRDDALQALSAINYSPVIAGDITGEKYESDYDALFYLIRRKIYKPYYPQKDFGEELWIDGSNFFNAPKGTTCIFINKELYLRSSPSEERKDTSDDTKLLKNIVFGNGTRILRHTGLSIKYKQRTGSNIYSWIHHRGRIWADYYLSFINRYSVIYALLTVIMIWFLIEGPLSLLLLIAFLIAGTALFLAENKKDFILVLRILPPLMVLFYAGTVEKLILKFKGKLKDPGIKADSEK